MWIMNLIFKISWFNWKGFKVFVLEVFSLSIFDDMGKGLNKWILFLDLGRLVGFKV